MIAFRQDSLHKAVGCGVASDILMSANAYSLARQASTCKSRALNLVKKIVKTYQIPMCDMMHKMRVVVVPTR